MQHKFIPHKRLPYIYQAQMVSLASNNSHELNQPFSSLTPTVNRYGKIQSNTFMRIQIYMKHRPGTE
jgi:hypothetical protein